MLGQLSAAAKNNRQEQESTKGQVIAEREKRMEELAKNQRDRVGELREQKIREQEEELERAKEKRRDALDRRRDAQDLRKRLENHYGRMRHFIRTRAEPTIFYLPAKQTNLTTELLDDTRQAIDSKIDSLKETIKESEEDMALINKPLPQVGSSPADRYEPPGRRSKGKGRGGGGWRDRSRSPRGRGRR